MVRICAAEARANVWAWRALTSVVAIAACGVVGIGFLSTSRSAADAARLGRALDLAGRQVLVLNSPVGETLSAVTCERLRALPQAKAAFALSPDPGLADLGAAGRVTVLRASPGLADYFGVATGPGRAVYAGPGLAERAGLVTGAQVSMVLDGAPSEPVPVTVVERSPRTGLIDDAIVVVDATAFGAEQCFVEAVPGSRAPLVVAIPAFLPYGSALRSEPLDAVLEADGRPERHLADLAGGFRVWSGALLLLALPLALWFARRAEWALYSSFGVARSRVVLIAAIEWWLIVGLPGLLAGMWGVLWSPTDAGAVPFVVASWNAVAMLAVGIGVVPLWAAYLRSSPAVEALKE